MLQLCQQLLQFIQCSFKNQTFINYVLYFDYDTNTTCVTHRRHLVFEERSLKKLVSLTFWVTTHSTLPNIGNFSFISKFYGALNYYFIVKSNNIVTKHLIIWLKHITFVIEFNFFFVCIHYRSLVVIVLHDVMEDE